MAKPRIFSRLSFALFRETRDDSRCQLRYAARLFHHLARVGLLGSVRSVSLTHSFEVAAGGTMTLQNWADLTTYEPLEPIFRWVWNTFGKEIASRTAEKAWEQVEWKLSAKKYSTKVRELYDAMRIIGLGTVPLEGIFTDVTILEKPKASRRYESIESLEKRYSAREQLLPANERKDGLDLVRNTRKLFILGGPGAGKTTFLKHIALRALDGEIEGVPIFITLKDLADSGQSILDFMRREFSICDFPDAGEFIKKLLEGAKAVVLFDGLDEVPEDKRRGQIAALKDFIRQYNKTRYVMTCRIAATDYSFEYFKYVEMADFSPEQIAIYTQKWFSQAEETGNRFLTELNMPKNDGLRELARTPLLLSLLCLAFEETLSFPQRRVELYEESLEALLKKWDASRHIRRDEVYRRLSLQRKTQMLAQIAARTFELEKYFFDRRELEGLIEEFVATIPQSDPRDEVDATIILSAIEAQHGILVERAKNIYSFAHLTFQEYFTARYIVGIGDERTQTQLLRHIAEDRWREVHLLTASMLYDANVFFDRFLESLDLYTAKDDALVRILQWIGGRSIDFHRATLAHAYVSLGYFLTCAANIAKARVVNPGIGYYSLVELAVEPQFAEGRFAALTITRDISNYFGLERSIGLDLEDREISRHYQQLAADPSFEYSLKPALEVARTLDLDRVHITLEAIPNSSPKVASEQLQRALEEYLPHPHSFTGYLKATKLLTDCLQLSIVSNRAAIEERLFLPPEDDGAWT